MSILLTLGSFSVNALENPEHLKKLQKLVKAIKPKVITCKKHHQNILSKGFTTNEENNKYSKIFVTNELEALKFINGFNPAVSTSILGGEIIQYMRKHCIYINFPQCRDFGEQITFLSTMILGTKEHSWSKKTIELVRKKSFEYIHFNNNLANSSDRLRYVLTTLRYLARVELISKKHLSYIKLMTEKNDINHDRSYDELKSYKEKHKIKLSSCEEGKLNLKKSVKDNDSTHYTINQILKKIGQTKE